jgi:pimeloyl-ACP methyl ester carboxylesterase
MPTVTTPNTGIDLFYEDNGDPAHETILLIMGLGAQLTLWPDEFVNALVGRGYRVIRFDNRDIGHSQKMAGTQPPKVVWQVLWTKLGWPPRVPYTLTDMAGDAAGLLDALGIEAAHVVGASMGGMIAQLMAVNHPDRVLSLTSMMSTTGNPKLPKAEKEAMDALTAPLPSLKEEDVVAHGINIQLKIGSPDYRPSEARMRARVLESVRRSVYPDGMPRQLAAIIHDGDRRERLAHITAPTLVLHGEADPLVKLPAGEDTARAIPGARLVTIPGWGHDVPVDLVDRLADEIADHAKAASGAESDAPGERVTA